MREEGFVVIVWGLGGVVCLFVCLEIGSHCGSQAGRELLILLPHSFEV